MGVVDADDRPGRRDGQREWNGPFTREGVLRAYEPFKGQRPDVVWWSLLPADDRPRHQTS